MHHSHDYMLISASLSLSSWPLRRNVPCPKRTPCQGMVGVPYKLWAAFSPGSYNHKEMNSAENPRQPASEVFSLEHSDENQPRVDTFTAAW